MGGERGSRLEVDPPAEGDRIDGEALFRVLAEQSSDILSVLDADGTWRFSVGAGLTALGYPQGFRNDDGLFSLLHPDDVEEAVAAFGEIADGRRRGGGDRPLVALARDERAEPGRRPRRPRLRPQLARRHRAPGRRA